MIPTETFLNGSNAAFLQGLLEQYDADPHLVPEEWRHFFAALQEGEREFSSSFPVSLNKEEVSPQKLLEAVQVFRLIHAYRTQGHVQAQLDPLGLIQPSSHPDLDPASYGFTRQDEQKPVWVGGFLGKQTALLGEVLSSLRQTYCHSVGVEFMHLQDPFQREWVQSRVEGERPKQTLSPAERREILTSLSQVEALEKFLHLKYPGAKRFGLSGAETLIPALQAVFNQVASQGVEEIVIGMAHRGRLSVLTHLLNQPLEVLFAQFQGKSLIPESVQGSGDVKYHLGYSADCMVEGKKIHVSLSSNPSHLESVNPVVQGKTRAKQFLHGDKVRKKVMSLLLHGDAAFVGQGLVAESLELSNLPGYRVGGTLHVIINNQIGFTTNPAHSRSSPYSSEIAKVIQAPIFHVNGDDPDAVVWVARLAAEFRFTFGQDSVIDLVCYRRYGHNESDEPSFTQPLMYKAVQAHPTSGSLYAKRLMEEEGMTHDTLAQQLYHVELEQAFEKARTYQPAKAACLEGAWRDIQLEDNQEDSSLLSGQTGISESTMQEIAQALVTAPSGFHLHPKIERQLKAKKETFALRQTLDWATAEALAFGSLLLEGKPVRLSGQDSQRGTFSQRHAVFVDQETEDQYVPLNYIRTTQAPFEVLNSPLAEASILGFEYGYATVSPHTLVVWEAQFGDFSNGAQVMIDQYIASGEAKWLRLCGLVLLLPHGYEGQGPEHSSGRLERYLQLCAQKNLQVVNCTTPANYFHVLRRQIHGASRKPLVIMTPKSLLRHKKAVSLWSDFQEGTEFQKVIPDPIVFPDKVQRVVICSGKVYYDLLAKREEQGLTQVALIRLEQLYPFPKEELCSALAPFKEATVIWCQEEPQNMGGWSFIDRRLEGVLEALEARQKRPLYIGRNPAASPATGFFERHQEEQNHLIWRALKF